MVVCIFSLVGFESATALGGEAANPLRNVPRAVTWSLAITGLFFVFVSYVEVLGTHDYSTPLSALAAPLNTLADIYHVGFLKIPIALGAMFSFFSLSLSCINAGARILYPMAAHGIFPAPPRDTHDRNRTPHIAITGYTIAVFAIPSVMQTFTNPLTTFGDAGTLAAFGFLLAYFLMTIASWPTSRPRRARPQEHRGLRAGDRLPPRPDRRQLLPGAAAPVRYFPYYFLAYLLIGRDGCTR